MELPEFDDLLAQARAEAEKMQKQAREATQLRLEWERTRTDDPELIKKLDQALAGEISWLDVMTSAEYETAHAAEFEEAARDFEERREAGTLPTPEEADAGLQGFMDTMRAEVAAAKEAEAQWLGTEPPEEGSDSVESVATVSALDGTADADSVDDEPATEQPTSRAQSQWLD